MFHDCNIIMKDGTRSFTGINHSDSHSTCHLQIEDLDSAQSIDNFYLHFWIIPILTEMDLRPFQIATKHGFHFDLIRIECV